MLPERATFEDGTNGVEAGVMDMLDRMQSGRWKVFSHLVDWFEEFRLYHRKDGLIVKLQDDLMSASRYGLMMKRFFRNGKASTQFVLPTRKPLDRLISRKSEWLDVPAGCRTMILRAS